MIASKEPKTGAEFLPLDFAGLTAQVAKARLVEEGYNELPSAKPKTLLHIAIEVLKEPMFLLLLACGVLYLMLGDTEEALILLFFVFVIIGITFVQERKTERALEALRDLSSPRALVIRDGQQVHIPGREVVRGDLVIVAEGERVPADGVLLGGLNLYADESLLTGESVPVEKVAGADGQPMERPGGDRTPFMFSGTLVVKGRGAMRVMATGLHTEVGKIGKALKTLEEEETQVQREVRVLVRNLAFIGVGMCVVVVLVYSLTRGDLLKGFLAGLTLAMSILPEEFPVILTIFMAIGAWRVSQKRALTRRIPAIETLGSTTVLCSDKTGTLTQNRMSVARLAVNGQFYDLTKLQDKPLPDECHTLVEYGILASQRDPFDPMEKAFHTTGEQYLSGTEHLHQSWNLAREYPLSANLLALSYVWVSPEGQDYVIAAKGAPEAVADLCHLSDEQLKAISEQVGLMAADGLRVLGVASSSFSEQALPGDQHDFNFTFLGLVGLADPIRPAVPAAIGECYEAGIRVVMITGDYPATAQSIARQIGISPCDKYLTGAELESLDEVELQRRVAEVNIFARVMPEHKLRLVTALKANGEVVAMTGDGVNDAPALKAAHIGVAMGGRGTDVAREAAALVLLDDDFSSIVAAVRLGRRIWDNLRKAMSYTLAIHVPIAGMSLLPVLFGWPLVLLPVHIVFLELTIDPACSIVFEMEQEEANVMSRPPRKRGESLFGWNSISLSLLQGLGVLLATLAVFAVGYLNGAPEDEARALAFVTLVVGNVGLIIVNRSWSRSFVQSMRTPNAALGWLVAGVTLFLAVAVNVPFVSEIFRFGSEQWYWILVSIVAGFASVAWFEIYKLVHREKL